MEKHETDYGLIEKSFSNENESKDQMKQDHNRLQDSPMESEEEKSKEEVPQSNP